MKLALVFKRSFNVWMLEYNKLHGEAGLHKCKQAWAKENCFTCDCCTPHLGFCVIVNSIVGVWSLAVTHAMDSGQTS